MATVRPPDKATQALLLILSLEEEAVARVLKHMEPEDIRLLHELAKGEFSADSKSLITAYQSFLSDARQPLIGPDEGRKYIERLAQKSLGREESKNILEGKDHTGSFTDIERRNPQAVAEILSEENPQVVAAILTELSPAYASTVIGHFDQTLQNQVITRISRMNEIPGSTVHALLRAVEEQLSELEADDAKSVDGMGRAALILQRLPIADTEEVLTTMGEEDPAMAHKLRRAMFCFEDLENVQGRGMQVLIKEVSNDQLLLALKTASDELKDKILASVSKRAAEIILDDLVAMGPVRLSEVEQSQQEIVDTALRLEAEGKIVIAGRGGEELV
ncbi:MAG: FliG C-terminal domain-containing protein [Myxococcota bacterium]|nr:FliG C-terminal domain-containing protein [Myxococcota bacterium]